MMLFSIAINEQARFRLKTMMQTFWIDPNDIEDVWVINNRKKNTGHIDSLAENMLNNGYLVEYPIIVFKRQRGRYHGR